MARVASREPPHSPGSQRGDVWGLILAIVATIVGFSGLARGRFAKFSSHVVAL